MVISIRVGVVLVPWDQGSDHAPVVTHTRQHLCACVVVCVLEDDLKYVLDGKHTVRAMLQEGVGYFPRIGGTFTDAFSMPFAFPSIPSCPCVLRLATAEARPAAFRSLAYKQGGVDVDFNPLDVLLPAQVAASAMPVAKPLVDLQDVCREGYPR